MNYSFFDNDQEVLSVFPWIRFFAHVSAKTYSNFKKYEWFRKLLKFTFRCNVPQTSIIIYVKVTRENVNYQLLKIINKKLLKGVTQKYLKTLYASMPNCLQAVIDHPRSHIKY